MNQHAMLAQQGMGVFPQVDVETAIDVLRSGHLLALPTETVYGLAASLECPDAISQIFKAKGRPNTHPLIVHIHHAVDSWKPLTQQVHPLAIALMKTFWPGSLTLVLSKSNQVPSAVTGGRPTVALRVPRHPVAQAILASGLAVVAPSANRFGGISPTTLAHVEAEFNQVAFPQQHRLHLLEGGACSVGVESTIVDASQIATQGLRVLRLGGTPLHAIELVAQQHGIPCTNVSHTAKPLSSITEASGTYARHYAPSTALRLVHVGDLEEALWQAQSSGQRVGVMAFSECPEPLKDCTHWIQVPLNVERYTQQLYAHMRKLDSDSLSHILVERPPIHGEWATVLDRLTRASTPLEA